MKRVRRRGSGGEEEEPYSCRSDDSAGSDSRGSLEVIADEIGCSVGIEMTPVVVMEVLVPSTGSIGSLEADCESTGVGVVMDSITISNMNVVVEVMGRWARW